MTEVHPQNETDAGAADPLSASLRWALAFGTEPDRSPLDWMAIELDPHANDAADAITRADEDLEVDLGRLHLLKSGFKTLRVGSEDPGDRRLAARFYAATIAAGVVRHRRWITNQRPARALAAIQDLRNDESMPASLRALASSAVQETETHVIYEPARE